MNAKQLLQDSLDKLEAAYKRDRAALLGGFEVAERMERQEAPNSVSVSLDKPRSSSPPPRENALKYGGVGKTIKLAVLSCSGEFTRNDVEVKLREMNPKLADRVNGNLSSYLWSFANKDKIIRMTEKGGGREQAKYVKA